MRSTDQRSDRRVRTLVVVAVLAAVVVVAIAVIAFVVTRGPGEEPHLSVTSGLVPESAELSSLYLTIDNAGGADHLVGVTTDAASLVDLHTSEGNVMVTTRSLAVPGHGRLALAPGGAHVMLDHLTRPLVAGDSFTVTLLFERSAPLSVPVEVVTYAELGQRLLPGAEASRP